MKKLMLLFAAFLFGVMQINAQSSVSGTVTSDDGNAFPGVTVQVKGTTVATMTDPDGKYLIEVPEGSNILSFSYVGYEMQEIEVTGDVINVVMKPGDQMLEEVVVTALGVTKERKALGYSVETVSGEDLQRSNADDVTKLIGSRTSGVTVTSADGSAGGAAYITIRGAASITGNNQPLYVIDGSPMFSGGGNNFDNGANSETAGNDMGGVQTSSRSADINPEDIASISILKGGAATALYGVQAANGVIMITTKRGKAGQKLKIDFTSSIGINKVSKLPERQNKYAQGSGGVWSSANMASWGPKMDTCEYSTNPGVWSNPEYDVAGAIVSQNDPLSNGQQVTPFDPYDIFQTGYTVNNNISISNGTKLSSYYISIGNRRETGILPKNYFNKTSFRINADTKLSDKVKTGANIAYTYSSGNYLQKGSNVSGTMLGLLRTPPSFDNSAGYQVSDGTQRTYRGGGGYDNPYWVSHMISFKDKTNRLMANVFVDYDMLDWLGFTYRISTDFYFRNYVNWQPIGTRNNPAGFFDESMRYRNIFNTDLIGKINKDIGDKFNLNFTFGANMYRNYYKRNDSQSNGGMAISGNEYQNVSNTTDYNIYTYLSEFRTMAIFGDLLLSYNSMLYLGVTAREEWATTMPEESLAAFYPSFNLGFVFSELDFLKGNKILSFGKLRASYAITANYAPVHRIATPYAGAGPGDGWTNGFAFPAYGQSSFSLQNTVGSPDLKHEKTKSFELGTELKFFKNRYGLDFSYYSNRSEDLLMSVPVARSSGFANQFRNAGTMETKGFEISLYLNPVKTKNFSWELSANFSKEKNKVIELAPGVDNLSLGGFNLPSVRAVAGEDYRSVYGYDWYRTPDGRLIINDEVPTADADGNYDPTGYGFPMPADTAMVSLGTINPDWTANISNTFTYRGISFSFLIDIKKGGIMYNGTRFAMNFFGTSIETENRDVVYNADGTVNLAETPAENIYYYDGVLGHLDGNGDLVLGGEANIPVVKDQNWFQYYGSNFGGGATKDALEDGSWVRLREISLSYSLPRKLISKIKMTRAEIFFTGTNLWLKTDYKGVDPETSLLGAANGQGFDYFNSPGKKTYTFGLRVTF